MAQQTAVEWILDKSLKHIYILNTEYVKDKRIIIQLDEFINLFEQAKQMEKEQIVNAFDNGRNAPDNYVGYGSQYFYETYEI